jgi:poly [ADP-ribose] polymerase
MKEVKLIMVTENNNNKLYNMKENDDGTFTATWGRVGQSTKDTIYPIEKWDKTYKSKIKKGYVDQTDLYIKGDKKSDLVDIENKAVKSLIEDLQNYSNISIAKNYQVSSEAVTQAQIDEAQSIMDKLVKYTSKRKKNVEEINSILLELYKTIPRKMKKVQDHLFDGSIKKDDLLEKIEDEQAILDTMAGQVSINALQNDTDDEVDDRTILEILGVEIDEVTADEEKYIKGLMKGSKDKYRKAFKVKHKKSYEKMNDFIKEHNLDKDNDVRDLWHGSRNENWLNILYTSLVLRPTNAVINGKMAGFGVYGADKAQKSIGYSSLSGSYWTNGNNNKGYLALFNFVLGNMLHKKRHRSWMYDLNWDNLRKYDNYHSLFFEGGVDLRNNEFVIYDDRQCSINYLIEIGN